LSNNNQFNLTNGDLNFTGTNDLNLGSGIMVMLNADRAINVANAAATLTVGGRIQDAGQNLGLTKSGPGTLVLGGNSLYTGSTNISGGTAVLNGSVSGNVSVAASATLDNHGIVGGNLSVSGTVTGAGTVNGSLVVNLGGTVDVAGGTLTVNGAVTNNGLFILSNGSQIAGVTGFINNGTLDLITAGTFNPPNFTNNGTIINSSVVKTKSVSRAGNNFSVIIDSYTGHTYQLQKSTTTPAGANFTTNIGPSQNGTTGTVLTLTDPAATASPSFYRILVSP
jgi:autotransporter-associated beta strand protein